MIWQIINSIVAVAALVFSLIVFLSERKERKLRMKQLLRENDEMSKADFQVTSDGKYICIKNIGAKEAYNIHFSCSDDLITDPNIYEFFPYPKINPGQSIKFQYCKECIDTVHQKITLTWDDNYKKNSKKDIVICLSYY